MKLKTKFKKLLLRKNCHCLMLEARLKRLEIRFDVLAEIMNRLKIDLDKSEKF